MNSPRNQKKIAENSEEEIQRVPLPSKDLSEDINELSVKKINEEYDKWLTSDAAKINQDNKP